MVIHTPTFAVAMDEGRGYEVQLSLEPDGTVSELTARECIQSLLNCAMHKGWFGEALRGKLARVSFDDDPWGPA